MGSSKADKADKRDKRDQRAEREQREERRERDAAELLAALRDHQSELARVADLLGQVLESRATVERQLERLLVVQQRTNSLLELSLGSAFDAELEDPHDR